MTAPMEATVTAAVDPIADDLERAVDLFCSDAGPTELRVLHTQRGTVSGYFTDRDKLIAAARALDGKGGVYLTLNPAVPEALARADNVVVPYAKRTTSDAEIAARRWLLVDLDPVRLSGIPATDAEHERALTLARIVYARFIEQGIPVASLVATDSGNGAAILVRVDLPNDDASRDLVKRVLAAVDRRFSTATVKVDCNVFNAARITRLPGTINCKGSGTDDRPHRRARLLHVPDTIVVCPTEILVAIAALEPEPAARVRPTGTGSTGSPFNLPRWLADRGLTVSREKPWNGGTIYLLEACPFDASHGASGEVHVGQYAGGGINFACKHDSCTGKTWWDVRALLEPGYRERRESYEQRAHPDAEQVNGTAPDGDETTAAHGAEGIDEQPRGPWARAVTVRALLTQADAEVEWIADAIAAPGSITGIASPRGLGKTHLVHALAVAVATGGTFRGRMVRRGRVLIIDRDNSRREIRRRLRQWCGDEPPETLEVLTRDDAPALTDARAWESFPFGRYALVILDSLGAATEGVSENDGGESGKALAPLLDLARRGPSVVVLLNVPKDASNYRGSGVIADRLDILYEVRDATDLVPAAGDETWWSRLPEAGEAAWADRARRRGRRDDYRLVLVATKYRIGEEPDPIALEVMLTPGAWAINDVTETLVEAHDAARGQAGATVEAARRLALDALAEVVRSRADAGAPLHKREAEDMLALSLPDVRRAARRTLVESGGAGRWQLVEATGRGRQPHVLMPVGGAYVPGSAAVITDPGTPCGARVAAPADMADLAAQGRPYSATGNATTGAGSEAVGLWPQTSGDRGGLDL
jgi:hypothetical protein